MVPKQTATGVIRYREDGEERTWSVGCMASESAEDLKAHLARWKPSAEFLGAEITPDRP